MSGLERSMSTPASTSFSCVSSRQARVTPTAIPATSGRVLSNVCMTPPKPAPVLISGEPRRSSFETRHSSRRNAAVSEARIPSLCSSRSRVMPGLERSTTNDLIAARPASRSSVAQTTTRSARSPAVT